MAKEADNIFQQKMNLNTQQPGFWKGGFDQIFPVSAFLDPSQIQLGGLGSAVSSPSGVWDGAPEAHEFGAFQTKKEAFGAIYIYRYFLKIFEDRNFDTFHIYTLTQQMF